MAYDATHGFTVQEATNLRVYDSYKCEILTLDGTTAKTTASWDSPAKEVVIYSAGGVADDDGITISLKVNGAHGADIVIAHDNLPFSIKGILMEQIKLTGGSGDNDVITVLSFH